MAVSKNNLANLKLILGYLLIYVYLVTLSYVA